MNKTFDIWPLMKERKLGEYRLELEAEELTVIFGRVEERESGRRLVCPTGCLQLLYIVEGAFRFRRGANMWTMVEGEMLQLEPEEVYLLENPRNRPSLYLLIGGKKKKENKETL